jgi:hypothetical protein
MQVYDMIQIMEGIQALARFDQWQKITSFQNNHFRVILNVSATVHI